MSQPSGSYAMETAEETSSLIDFLRRPNPTVNSEHSWKGNNTKSTSFTGKKPKEFVEWTDFNYDTLQAIYGDVLKRKIPQHDVPNFQRHLPFHLCEIQDKDSLEALLVRWNNAVVSYALSFAQCTDPSRVSTIGYGEEDIFMARGSHAYIA